MTNDDAVSREAVYRLVDDIIDNLCENSIDLGALESWGREQVMDLPSVTQKSGKWIPVSNRLPFSDEEYHTFLVTDSNGKVTLSEFYLSLSDSKPYWSGMIDVIAWMPLPKPYEPQKSEDKE